MYFSELREGSGGSSGGMMITTTLSPIAAKGYGRNRLGLFFFANPPGILLTPRVHDFYRAQGEGSGGGGGTAIATALSTITTMGCGHDLDLR